MVQAAKANSSNSEALRNGIRAIAPPFVTAVVFSFFINLLLFVPALYMLQIYDRVLGTRNLVTLAGITVIAGASAVLTPKSARKLGHGVIALAALWSLVAALAFSGTLLTWLVFADAIAVGVLALADLTAHEATTEKVVHQLVVHDGTMAGGTAEQRAAA